MDKKCPKIAFSLGLSVALYGWNGKLEPVSYDNRTTSGTDFGKQRMDLCGQTRDGKCACRAGGIGGSIAGWATVQRPYPT